MVRLEFMVFGCTQYHMAGLLLVTGTAASHVYSWLRLLRLFQLNEPLPITAETIVLRMRSRLQKAGELIKISHELLLSCFGPV